MQSWLIPCRTDPEDSVKFQMAPNSLFAILLRSRWWLSFALALGVTVL